MERTYYKARPKEGIDQEQARSIFEANGIIFQRDWDDIGLFYYIGKLTEPQLPPIVKSFVVEMHDANAEYLYFHSIQCSEIVRDKFAEVIGRLDNGEITRDQVHELMCDFELKTFPDTAAQIAIADHYKRIINVE